MDECPSWDTTVSRSAEVFDPGSGAFRAVGSTAALHGDGLTATRLLSGKVLILGGRAEGFRSHAVAEIFDPATDAFTMIAPMTSARSQHTAVLMSDGKVLITGGIDDEGTTLATAEIYDPGAGTFTRVADMPLPASEHAAVAVSR